MCIPSDGSSTIVKEDRLASYIYPVFKLPVNTTLVIRKKVLNPDEPNSGVLTQFQVCVGLLCPVVVSSRLVLCPVVVSSRLLLCPGVVSCVFQTRVMSCCCVLKTRVVSSRLVLCPQKTYCVLVLCSISFMCLHISQMSNLPICRLGQKSQTVRTPTNCRTIVTFWQHCWDS